MRLLSSCSSSHSVVSDSCNHIYRSPNIVNTPARSTRRCVLFDGHTTPSAIGVSQQLNHTCRTPYLLNYDNVTVSESSNGCWRHLFELREPRHFVTFSLRVPFRNHLTYLLTVSGERLGPVMPARCTPAGINQFFYIDFYLIIVSNHILALLWSVVHSSVATPTISLPDSIRHCKSSRMPPGKTTSNARHIVHFTNHKPTKIHVECISACSLAITSSSSSLLLSLILARIDTINSFLPRCM